MVHTLLGLLIEFTGARSSLHDEYFLYNSMMEGRLVSAGCGVSVELISPILDITVKI